MKAPFRKKRVRPRQARRRARQPVTAETLRRAFDNVHYGQDPMTRLPTPHVGPRYRCVECSPQSNPTPLAGKPGIGRKYRRKVKARQRRRNT